MNYQYQAFGPLPPSMAPGPPEPPIPGPVLVRRSFLKKIRVAVVVGWAMTLVLACNRDTSPWIWKIEGKKITVAKVEAAYNAYFLQASQQLAAQLQVSQDKIKQMVENIDQVENKQIAGALMQLRKENFAQQYKQFVLINKEAKKSGFLRNKEMKAKIEFMKAYLVANLYIAHKLKPESIVISDDEGEKECERLRKRDKRLRPIPIDQCIGYATTNLKRKILEERQTELLRSITESYRIIPNPDFNYRTYVKEQRKQSSDKDKVTDSDAAEDDKDKKKKK